MQIPSSSAFWRYWLYQLPSWAAVGLVLSLCVSIWGLSPRAAVVLFLFWFAKDLVFYPFVKSAYHRDEGNGSDLIGRRGTARDPLEPDGYVLIGSERWRARAVAPVPSGGRVRITAVDGLTLLVEAESEDASAERR